MLKDVYRDLQELTRMITGRQDWRSMLQIALHYETFAVTSVQRLRVHSKKFRVVGINHALKVMQRIVHGIEIGKEVQMGHGIWFIHPTAIVIGGTSKIGNRVRFFGSNTLGQAKEDGYPTLEDDVWVGAGARVLGPIRVGARSIIGANAVVLQNVPPDSVAIGMPARVVPKKRDFPIQPA